MGYDLDGIIGDGVVYVRDCGFVLSVSNRGEETVNSLSVRSLGRWTSLITNL